MTIRVISIGKTNVPFIQEGLRVYLDRLKHYTKLDWEELPDPKKVDRSNAAQVKEKEGELLLQKLKPTDVVILLDERGKSISSTGLAQFIDEHQLYAQSDLVLVIGGAYGFSDGVYARANRKWSLSAMTFTHQMVRLFLAEQLYRAFTILKGEPYHHA